MLFLSICMLHIYIYIMICMYIIGLVIRVKESGIQPATKPKVTYGYDLIKLALLKYKELHGDVSVKHDFVVPKDRYVYVCVYIHITLILLSTFPSPSQP
jgi:hypothetical protein